MRIVRLAAENFKRLRAVEIAPDGNMIEIRGKNGAGKSSILDAIWCAVGGGDVLPKKPIRRGCETARIELDLGELIVTRRFTPNGSSVVVEAASGARFRAPQHMLDELIGAIAFDPLEFTRMEPAKQLNSLRRLVKLEVDIDALDGQNARDYERRTEVNRDVKRLRGQASGIQYPADLPSAPPDAEAITARLRNAGEINAGIEAEKGRRQNRFDEVADKDVERLRVLETAAERRAQAARLLKEADHWEGAAATLAQEIERGRAELAGFLENPVAELIDTAALVDALAAARSINSQLEEKARRETLEAEAAALEERAAQLTASMAGRAAAKTTAIADAVMPVEGLGFGDGEVLFNDLPLDQASQAEKIRVSVAIAMAANPKLKVLCIRDGSLLDRDSWQLLSELVASNDYQCWVEVTDDDADHKGKTGIIIEDGAVHQHRPEPEAASQPALALEGVS
jgi:hypothetical protein